MIDLETLLAIKTVGEPMSQKPKMSVRDAQVFYGEKQAIYDVYGQSCKSFLYKVRLRFITSRIFGIVKPKLKAKLPHIAWLHFVSF